jgi:hypothetical protein
MKLAFIDESGYSRNWIAEIDEQPFCVLSAVCVDAATYPRACTEIRQQFEALNLPRFGHPLGKGGEIKARDVARGGGWWQEHDHERNRVRDLMVSFPARYNGVGIVVVIDKKRHLDRYGQRSENPVTLSLKYLFERLEWYLRSNNSEAYCVYDHDERRTDALHDQSVALFREGSEVIYWSKFYHHMVKSTHRLDQITELALGRSHNSVGLQVADFLATMTYTYFRDGQPSSCRWWDTLCASLYRGENGELSGLA